VDRDDSVVFVQFPRKKVLQFELFDLLSEGFEIFLDILKENFTAFFIKYSQRLLQVGQFALDSIERGDGTFKS
jgi:hypothetical protein